MPNKQNQMAWDAMMGTLKAGGVGAGKETDRAKLIEGMMTTDEFHRRHGATVPDMSGVVDRIMPKEKKKKSYFNPETGKKITREEYDKYLFKEKRKIKSLKDIPKGFGRLAKEALNRMVPAQKIPPNLRIAKGAKGGQVPKMEAVKRLVEMWKPKTKEGKLYDDQLARAVMALGGVVPEGRRLYGTNPKKKKKTVMQTSTAGMPVRGETYKKGGKVKMPKGWHV